VIGYLGSREGGPAQRFLASLSYIFGMALVYSALWPHHDGVAVQFSYHQHLGIPGFGLLFSAA
jgi:hypothetical protein